MNGGFLNGYKQTFQNIRMGELKKRNNPTTMNIQASKGKV